MPLLTASHTERTLYSRLCGAADTSDLSFFITLRLQAVDALQQKVAADVWTGS
jgi:hypothetical protein